MTAIEQRGDLWSTMPGWGIVANLLPPEVVSARRIRAIRKRMVFVLAAVVVLAAAGYGYAFWQARSAQNDLSAEQSRTTALISQQHRYSAVTEIHTNVSQVNSQLGNLMAGDVDVPTLVTQVLQKLPAGVTLSEVSVNVNNGAQQGSGSTNGSSNPTLDTSDSKHVGTISLNGDSSSMANVATFVDALSTVPGIVDATAVTNTGDAKGTRFTVTINLTDKVLSHSFDSSKAGK